MTERKKSWVFALVVTIAFICVSLVCAGTVSAAVVVDQDLVWQTAEPGIATGGGIEQYVTSPVEYEQPVNYSLGGSGLHYALGTSEIDLSAYDRCRFSFFGNWDLPFYYETGPEFPSDAYVIIPAGTLDNGNADWGYTDSFYNGSVAAAFGNVRLVGYESISIELYTNGTEILQHVVISEGIPGVDYRGELYRYRNYSVAELYYQSQEGEWIMSSRNTGSDDWSFGAGFQFGVLYRLDVTVNGQTQSVSWGGSVPPTGIPTPIPTNNTTVIPTLDLDNDPLGLDDWGPGGAPPLPPALPDLPTINIPDPDDFFDPFLNDTNNVTRPLFDMVDQFASGFWDGLFGGVANVWSSLWASFADLVDGVKNFFYQIDDLMYKASGFMYDLSPVIYAVVPSVVWYLALITVWGSVVVLGYQLVTSPLVDLLRSKFDYWTLKDQYGRFGGK